MIFILRAVATLALLCAASNATSDSQVHLRVSGDQKASSQGVAEWGQCQFIDHKYSCQTGLFCAVYNEHYGQCIKVVADPWTHCAGHSWRVSCELGSDCVYHNPYYSQCVPKSLKSAAPAAV